MAAGMSNAKVITTDISVIKKLDVSPFNLKLHMNSSQLWLAKTS